MRGYKNIASTFGSILLLLFYGIPTEAGLADTWGYCECEWVSWEGFSDCTSDCFGQRHRSRSVLLREHPGCDEFTDCASNDMGHDYQDCNDVCHNGGTPTVLTWQPCTCQIGYTSKCCTEIVNCGTTSDISDGTLSVTSTNYGGTATYTCNTHYNMTGGDRVRTCQHDAVWSGVIPSCIFANHCGSSPCLNGATCVDLLGDFRCDCLSGWSGQFCENDVQPPVMTGCGHDVYVNATDHTVPFNWTVPSFTDPLGNDLDIVSNFLTPGYTFPWGDHTVQYVATKLSNGLSTECKFEVKVRPTPCQELNIPLHGALLCNNWNAEYGQFCMIACQDDYNIGPSDVYAWYVCGASGTWMAPSPVPDCSVPVDLDEDLDDLQAEHANYAYTSSCNDDVTKDHLQDLYLNALENTDGFSSYCSSYPSECQKENVDVRC